MHRTSSALFLGLFAVSAALQGAAACSNNTATPPEDSGTPPGAPEDAGGDTGATTPLEVCTGPVPVMTVTGPNGDQIAPDWGCYDGGAGFLYHPRPTPYGNEDAGDDAGDASADAADAADSAPTPDAGPVDSSAPDSSTGDDAGDAGLTYTLHLTDFVSDTPPVGAIVNIFWGGSTVAPIAFTGQIDVNGNMLFPTPPSGEHLLTYHVNSGGDAGQASEYWVSSIIQPPPGATSFNSLSVASETELLKSILGSETPNPSDSLVVTGACDCQYRDVYGGQFQMVDTTTGNPVVTGNAAGDTRVVYLQNNLPATSCKFSTNQGGRAVWTMINAPADANKRYELQFMGRMTGSQATPTVFAKYPVESYAGSVSVLRGFRLNATPPN